MNKRFFAITTTAIIAVMVVAGILLFGANWAGDGNPRKSLAQDIFHKDPPAKKKGFPAFKPLEMVKEDVHISFEGKDLQLTLPVYNDINRLYLPLSEIVEDAGGKLDVYTDQIDFKLGNYSVTIDMGADTYTIADPSSTPHKLKKPALLTGDVAYITLFDFQKILGLKTDWDSKNRSIGFYWDREQAVQKARKGSGKPALVRFEDLTTRSYFSANPDGFGKLRIVADYMYVENIPYHVAWIPRFVDPRYKIDNDLTKNLSNENADFLFAIDYMVDRNALFGLHGYTHQYGNTVSIECNEFMGYGIPENEKYVKERIFLAKENARILNIPIHFFEPPHYAISPKMLPFVEQEFDIIFQHYPNIYGKITERKSGNRTVKYIPTNLDYLNGKFDVNVMLNKIKNLPSNSLGSFFMNPIIEFEDITVTHDETGYPTAHYSETSVIHQLSKALNDKGYSFVTVHDL